MICKQCGSPLLNDAEFCTQCGTRIERTYEPVQTAKYCIKCGNKLFEKEAFCQKCGTIQPVSAVINIPQPNMSRPNMSRPNIPQPNMLRPNIPQSNMLRPNIPQPNMLPPNIRLSPSPTPNILPPNIPPLSAQRQMYPVINPMGSNGFPDGKKFSTIKNSMICMSVLRFLDAGYWAFCIFFIGLAILLGELYGESAAIAGLNGIIFLFWSIASIRYAISLFTGKYSKQFAQNRTYDQLEIYKKLKANLVFASIGIVIYFLNILDGFDFSILAFPIILEIVITIISLIAISKIDKIVIAEYKQRKTRRQ